MVRNYLATSDTIWNCQKLSGIARKKICIASLRAFNVFHININFISKLWQFMTKLLFLGWRQSLLSLPKKLLSGTSLVYSNASSVGKEVRSLFIRYNILALSYKIVYCFVTMAVITKIHRPCSEQIRDKKKCKCIKFSKKIDEGWYS